MKGFSFEKLYAWLWPFSRDEVKKFLPLALMMFCILFNYTIVRDIKDALIVKEAGAEIISFIKFWVVMPLAMLFVLLYSKLSNVFSKDQLFQWITLVFVIFFAAFGFVLYPLRDILLPNPDSVASVIASLPAMRWFIMIYAKWIYILFYAFAELWGSVIISLLFWQFANQITSVSEAKKYYPMFGLVGNLGLIVSGQTLKGMTLYGQKIVGDHGNPFDITLQYILVLFIFFGLFFIYLYRMINKDIVNRPDLYNTNLVSSGKKKLKLSFKDSVKLIISSRYLFLIFIIVISYGVSINLVEVTWKKQVGYAFTSINDYAAFMGDFSTYTGIMTILIMFVGSSIIRFFGWLAAAVITPVVLLITSFLFFNTIIFKDALIGLTCAFGTTPLMLAVIIGMIQNILTKASKYSLFDATKEMAYIPLDEELKVKGKAAIDVVGSRLGKSGGSLIQQLMLTFIAAGAVNGQEIIAPYLFAFIAIMIIAWIFAARGLSKEFIKNTASS